MNIANTNKNEIKSWIFMDLESTGLPMLEKTKTRITELCMVSISRDQLMTSLNKNDEPRAQEKLVLVMNPTKGISKVASEMTGLTNSNLDTELPFNKRKADVIQLFFQQCQQPACIIAHNGFRFDFPLLREELKNFDDNIIPEQLFCADSIEAFRYFGKQKSDNAESMIFNPYNTELDVNLCAAADEIEKIFSSPDEKEIRNRIIRMQEINETTPEPQLISRMNVDRVKRNLFSNGDSTTQRRRGTNFSLNNIYEDLFQEGIERNHTAEGDVIALIRCCVKTGKPIFDWFDNHNKLFSSVKPMYG